MKKGGNFMSSRNNNYSRNGSCSSEDHVFKNHIADYIGETVTIFTSSGGPSGCGFTGLLMEVNCDFVRLSIRQGSGPSNPLSDTVCGNGNGNCMESCGFGCSNDNTYEDFRVGAVCDIPTCAIVAFCHNAI